ncbi:Hypothetical protein CINCED_3A004713 [Cinara cedri]|uniref:Reverse transcriptase domain n=1 Tax=Cinara cedri TaxID=506608 RepID=A0A5E4M7F7_9HEMI|nr:Hypothetical protein CINCED_3A004713 [Cinara cedri]
MDIRRLNREVILKESSIKILTYADDFVPMEELPNALGLLFNRLQIMASKEGLQTNKSKTKYIVLGKQKTADIYMYL